MQQQAKSEHVATPVANSINEASRRMGVSKGTLYNLVNAGQLRTITVGKRRLVPESELQRFVAERMAVQA